MKKSIISAILLVILILTLGYLIHNSKKQKENLISLNKNIENIKLINKDFDIYLTNPLKYKNFDIIEEQIELFNDNNNKIVNNEILKEKFPSILEEIKNSNQIKIKKIHKVKSYNAVLNNSFRIIQKLKKKIHKKDFEHLYVDILTLDKNPELDIKDVKKELTKLSFTNQTEKYFLLHSKTILNYLEKLYKIRIDINKLDLNKQLNTLHRSYQEYAKEAMKKAHFSIVILFTLLFSMIVIYLIYAFKLIISNNRLSRFKRTVENSDNIVVITDKEQNIKYVNEAFTKATGYTAKEAIGEKPSILKSGKQSKEFYENLNKTINSGKKWSGKFINVDKNGNLSYEKASITPVLDDNNEVKEFIAIKLDITNEIIKNEQLREKENLLIQQSKMAAMGEMLENIAHQWRQPLSTISTISTGIMAQKEYGMSNEEDEIKKLNEINESVQYLSQTINDFRDFFKPNKEKTIFNITHTYKKALNLLKSKFKSRNIEVIDNTIDIEINGLENEFIQVIMNILSNARDALDSTKMKRKLIFVNIYKKEQNVVMEIKDNAGGVPEDIIDKIFEPYFTTKHQSQGTGIGLYMSYEMVTKHIKGTLSVENLSYKYEDEEYKGACFTITIPFE